MVEFVPGQKYRRRELHLRFGGQYQGGISTPSGWPFIFLFTGTTGERYGYHDGWQDDGTFTYFGEGQSGDMEFVRGNRAVRDHISDGRDLLLFERAGKGFVRFVGVFVCGGFEYVQSRDAAGTPRSSIAFRLVPLQSISGIDDGSSETFASSDNLSYLRDLAIAGMPNPSEVRTSVRTIRVRSAAIRAYVLARAGGICENCRTPAPFETSDGQPFLEVHHLRRLADGGPDHPLWVAALCPNCHRHVHYANDALGENEQLKTRVHDIERRLEPTFRG